MCVKCYEYIIYFYMNAKNKRDVYDKLINKFVATLIFRKRK